MYIDRNLKLLFAICATVIQLCVASAEPVLLFSYFDNNGRTASTLLVAKMGVPFTKSTVASLSSHHRSGITKI